MITSQKTLLRIQLGVVASFLLVKFILRPFILENEYGGFLKIFVLSYPNFCEAIVGTIVLTFFLLIINSKVKGEIVKLQEKYIPFIAVLISGIYVLLQEFKIHNLGGNNVFDIYDVIFSLVGLITVLCLLIYIKPKLQINN